MFISCARQRTIFGSTSYNQVSRFVKEIPSDLLDGYEEVFAEGSGNSRTYEDSRYEWRYGQSKVTSYKAENTAFASKPKPEFAFRSAESFLSGLNKKSNSDIDVSIYKAGQRIYHKKFGEGKINYVEYEGDDAKVDITFEKAGHKRLMAKFAGLEILD